MLLNTNIQEINERIVNMIHESIETHARYHLSNRTYNQYQKKTSYSINTTSTPYIFRNISKTTPPSPPKKNKKPSIHSSRHLWTNLFVVSLPRPSAVFHVLHAVWTFGKVCGSAVKQELPQWVKRTAGVFWRKAWMLGVIVWMYCRCCLDFLCLNIFV